MHTVVECDGALHRLYEIPERDLRCLPTELYATIGTSGGLQDPCGHQPRHHTTNERHRQESVLRDFCDGSGCTFTQAGEVKEQSGRVVGLA